MQLPAKSKKKEVIKKVKNIGIDIGKKKCFICVMDEKGTILEESNYDNTLHDAEIFAKSMVKKYKKEPFSFSFSPQFVKSLKYYLLKNMNISTPFLCVRCALFLFPPAQLIRCVCIIL